MKTSKKPVREVYEEIFKEMPVVRELHWKNVGPTLNRLRRNMFPLVKTLRLSSISWNKTSKLKKLTVNSRDSLSTRGLLGMKVNERPFF